MPGGLRPVANPEEPEVTVEIEVPEEVVEAARERRRQDRERFERRGVDLEYLADLDGYLLAHVGVRFSYSSGSQR